MSLKQYFGLGSAVFNGKVINVKPSRGHPVFATLRVVESFKGGLKPGQRVQVATGQSGGGCGVEFMADSTLVVFARMTKGRKDFLTTICAGTCLVREMEANVESYPDSLRLWARKTH